MKITITMTGYHFVMFYAPWCGHCRALHPTWDELAAKHNKMDEKQVNIAAIDCDANEELCNAKVNKNTHTHTW